MNLKIFIFLFGIFFIFKQTEAMLGGGKNACAGHKVTPEFVRDCKGYNNPHGRVVNYTFVLNDDCEFIPKACWKWKKVDADTAQYTIKITEGKKVKLEKNGTASICEGFKSQKWEDAKNEYETLRPLDCALSKVDDKEGLKCIKQGKTKLEIPVFAWGIAKGVVHGKVYIYDSANAEVKSCYEFEVLVDYKKSG